MSTFRKWWLLLAIAALSLSALPAHADGLLSNVFTTVATGTTIKNSGTAITLHKLTWNVTSGSPASCTVALDSSVDGVTWVAGGVIAGQTCTSNGSSAITSATVNYVRINVTALSASTTIVVTWTGYVNAPGGLAPNTPGIATNNGNIFYATNYGVKADTYAVFDAVCSNGSPIVTSATAHFQTNAKIKVGQTMWAIPGAGVGNGSGTSIAKTTVLSIDSDSQIHASANGNVACGSAQALIWGDDDTAALNSAWAATIAPTNCGTLVLPSGMMMVSAGVFNAALPTACAAELDNNAAGVVGSAWQTTTLAPTPDFDLTTCSGSGKVACFGTSAITMRDWQVNGFGLFSTTVSSTTATLISISTPTQAYNISCQAFAYGNTNLTGISIGTGLSYMYNTQSAQCGAIGPTWTTGTGAGPIVGSYWVPGNGASPTVQSATPGYDFVGGNWVAISGVNECAFIVTGFAHFYTGVPAAPGAEFCVTGGHATFSGSVFSHNQGIAGRAALKITSGGVVSATGATFTDAGAGEFSVSVDATSTFIDGCGNTYTGAINVTAGGKFIPCPGTVYPTGTSVPTLTGTGACATFSTQTGTIYYGSFKCTGTSGAATITLTPGTTATNGFRCSASDTTTAADTITTGTLATGSCAFSAAAIASGDVISFNATPF